LVKKSKGLGTCTAEGKTGQRCTNKATRPGIPEIYSGPLCDTCRKRIHRQNTKSCSEPGCPNKVKNEKSRKERYKPKPWCRLHEHRALAADVIGESERSRVKEDLAKNIESNWLKGCWHWTGRASGGYGKYKGRQSVGTWQAHRLAWHLFFPGHGRELVCDHTCVNSLCVNPLHLNPITQGKNIQRRDQRRKDLSDAEHEQQNHQIPLSLLTFASLNNLVFIVSGHDYSTSWNPIKILARELNAERIESAGPLTTAAADPNTTPMSLEQLKRLQQLGIKKDKTARDLALTQYEADYLIGFKQQKRRLLETHD